MKSESSKKGEQQGMDSARTGCEIRGSSTPRFRSSKVNRNHMAFLPSGSQLEACVRCIGEFYYQITGHQLYELLELHQL